jgi:hypothetical protein
VLSSGLGLGTDASYVLGLNVVVSRNNKVQQGDQSVSENPGFCCWLLLSLRTAIKRESTTYRGER